MSDLNLGRGAFSVVLKVELSWPTDGSSGSSSNRHDSLPTSIVAKLPVGGPNGQAAVASGAYQREALAYRELLRNDPERHPPTIPRVYLVDEPGDGTCSLLLEDLSGHRAVDQLDGLNETETTLVAEELARLHRYWGSSDRLEGLAVRRNTIAGLPPEGLSAGLQALETIWADTLTNRQREAYSNLLAAKPELARAFADQRATLCHGDPRADNLVFSAPVIEGGPESVVLFDWQQMAVQFGEADLAWLCATSLDVEVRRQAEHRLVAAYQGSFDRYRLGLALPGLTVLLLAQREATTERTRRFIATSLVRIASAIDDLDVAGIV
ncbi:MAG: phosphotransferase [Acidimicrobiales bacterium]